MPDGASSRRRTGGIAGLASAVLLAACGGGAGGGAGGGGEATAPSTAGKGATAADAPAAWFTDVTAEVGLDFTHHAGEPGTFGMPDIMGSGGALFDADGDGDLDLFLVDGGRPGDGAGAQGGGSRLFLQQPGGAFRDATAGSGIAGIGAGMGCALGDLDNDGDLDLYVTAYGADHLFRNDGGGRFTDVTAAAGLGMETTWSTSAATLDFDGDGWLDLYVAHYVDYDPGRPCRDRAGQPEYCGPASFRGVPDALYRNRGDGTFADVTAAAGIDRVAGKGLGVVVSDFDGDGRTDVYVANDGEANQLWLNRGGRFEERAVVMGAAVNLLGRTEASMGVAMGDVDGDGDLDLFMTHLVEETNTLYLDQGGGFEDRTFDAGLGAPSLAYTGFGTGFFDADQDGDLDVLVVNGKVRRDVAAALPAAEGGEPDRSATARGASPAAELAPYAEPNQLFANDGSGRFREVGAACGTLCSRREISRGLTFGDVDGDGDLDLVVTNNHGPARLFRNDVPAKGHWLAMRAIDGRLKRDAVGALVSVEAGGRRLVRPVSHAYSYLSSTDATLYFGLGAAAAVDRITVRWPGGAVEEFAGGPADRRLVVERGQGHPATGR
jgi:enediyne biosynthesis protein E4